MKFSLSFASAIIKFGKTKILDKLQSLKEVQSEANKFNDSKAEPETIGNSSIRLFELLFSNSSANRLYRNFAVRNMMKRFPPIEKR